MKLADIIDTFITGDWGEEFPTQDTPNAAYCVRGADIVPITNHNFTDIPQRYVCDRTKETKLLAAGDLVIENREVVLHNLQDALYMCRKI